MRHLVAARARGESTQAGVETLAGSAEYDDSLAGTPRGAFLILQLIAQLLFTPVFNLVTILGTFAVAWFGIQHGRAAIGGWFFATASVVAVVFLGGLFSVAVNAATPRIVQAAFGRPLIPPASVTRTQMSLAIRAAQSYEVTLDANAQSAVNRLADIDTRATQAAIATGTEGVAAFLDVRDPKTGATMDEIEGGNLKVAQTLGHFAAVGAIATRLSNLAFLALAVLAVSEANGSIAQVTLVQTATGLVLFVGVVVILTLTFRFAVMQIMRADYSTLSPASEASLTEADKDYLDAMENRYLYPEVSVDDGFYRVLRHFLVRLHAPLMLLNLAAVVGVFAAAAFVTWAWPAPADDWNGQLLDALWSLVIISLAYLAGLWVALIVVQRARTALKPIVTAILTGLGTVGLMYLASGTFEARQSISAIAAALPAAVITGVVASFFRSGD